MKTLQKHLFDMLIYELKKIFTQLLVYFLEFHVFTYLTMIYTTVERTEMICIYGADDCCFLRTVVEFNKSYPKKDGRGK